MKPLRVLFRAARLRCPHCGGGGLRVSPLALRDRCPSCGLRLDRGERDYFLGSYTINLFGALILAGGFAVLAVPGVVPGPWLTLGGIAAITGFAVWFHPFSRVLWLAVDLVLRPATPRDFA